MAEEIPLNKFRTFPVTLGAEPKQVIYTCPPGVAAVVLFAQVANITDTDGMANPEDAIEEFTPFFVREGVYTELLYKAQVYPHDAARTIVGGRLILTPGDQIAITASSPNLKLNFSVLETATGGQD
jgi:hypothetical protein